MTKVLVAVDDDEPMEVARVAHRLFGDAAEYLAVHVAHREPAVADQKPRVDWTAPSGWGQVQRFQPLQDLSDRATPNPFASTEWAPAESAPPSDVADAILAAAREHGVDVIVVGSHDRGWLGRLFHHSVADDVVRHAPIPVLVAR